MNTIQIYTRSYIRKDGTWSMSIDTIKSVRKLLNIAPLGSVKWLVFISGIGEPEVSEDLKWTTENNFFKFKDLMFDYSDQVEQVNNNMRCSTGQARQVIFQTLDNYYSYLEYDMQDFLMNLDDDDELTNQEDIVKFINSNGNFSDLVGFGLDVPEDSVMRGEWYWDKAKFDYSRRYLTTDTQTMFLFLHRFKVVKRLLIRGLDLSKCTSDPVEEPEDTYLAIQVAKYNMENQDDPISVDAICSNFIKYNLNGGQTSKKQTEETRRYVQSLLKEYGYLYVTGQFYKVYGNEFRAYTPKKPKELQ